MEVVQYRQAPSFYEGTKQIQLHDGRVRTIHDNQTRIQGSRGSTRPYYETSSRGKGKPHKSRWNASESKRKRRVAKYKIYEMEGKVKSAYKEGFRSFKIMCMKMSPIFS